MTGCVGAMFVAPPMDRFPLNCPSDRDPSRLTLRFSRSSNRSWTRTARAGSSTSSEMTDEDKASAGISPGLVRLSVGYTGTLEQRWQQLRDALNEVGKQPAAA